MVTEIRCHRSAFDEKLAAKARQNFFQADLEIQLQIFLKKGNVRFCAIREPHYTPANLVSAAVQRVASPSDASGHATRTPGERWLVVMLKSLSAPFRIIFLSISLSVITRHLRTLSCSGLRKIPALNRL